MSRRSLTIVVSLLVLTTLTACGPSWSKTPPPPLSQLLLTGKHLHTTGWEMFATQPEHEARIDVSGSRIPCDGGFPALVDTEQPQLVASATFLRPGATFEQSILTGVDRTMFRELLAWVEHCHDTPVEIVSGDASALLLTNFVEVSPDEDAVDFEIEFIAAESWDRSAWLYAHLPGDRLLTVAVLGDLDLADDVFERALRAARPVTPR